MLEESGRVVATDGPWLWVETQPRSACSHCGSGGCTTSVIAKLFGARRNRLRLHNAIGATVGQQVVFGIPDQVLVAVSLRAYLVPLLGMIGAVVLAGLLGMGELLQAGSALLGLFAGLAWMGRAAGRSKARQRYQPQLLRLANLPAVQVDLPEPTRSRS